MRRRLSLGGVDSSSRAEEALAKLDKYNARHRKISQLENLRLDWAATQQRLDNAEKSLTTTVSKAAENFSCEAMGPQLCEWTQLIRDASKNASALLEIRAALEARGAELALEARGLSEEVRAALPKQFGTVSRELDGLFKPGDDPFLVAELREEWESQPVRREETQEGQETRWESETDERCFEACLLGATSHAQVMERLRLRLPQKSERELRRRCESHAAITNGSRQRRAFEADRAEWRRSFLARAKQRLETSRAENAEREKTELEHENLERRRKGLHDVLERLRRDRAIQDAKEAERNAVSEREAAALQRAAARQRLKEQTARKDAISAYRATIAARRAGVLRAEEEDERVKESNAKQNLLSTKRRVVYRASLAEQKQQSRQLELEKLAQHDAARLRALARLAESTPCAKAVAAAKSDLSKLTAATVARNQRSGERSQTGLAYADTQDQPITGFTDAQLFKDPRFRLASALRDAGLAHTNAARIAVQKLVGGNTTRVGPIV